VSLQARYSGLCPECDQWWAPGDLIRTNERREWRHVVCPADDLTPDHPVCQTCWLAHPEGACDR
jgi:hypothetical protein